MTSGIKVVVLIFIVKLSAAEDNASQNDLDVLTPYIHQHGPRWNHRHIRDCHAIKYGSTEPYELHPAHTSPIISVPFLTVKRFVKEIPDSVKEMQYKMPESKNLRGHYAVISDPLRTLSVLEPNQPGGCGLNIRQTVENSSHQKNCLLAINGGYFNTKNGSCLGNVVSDGKIVHDSGGVQNAHFGLKKDGNIFSGYLSEEELHGGSFQQLVGGVVMILKQGNEFVNFSKFLECESTEETGSMDQFADILSARTAIGHNAEGKVIIVQVDGKTGKDGASLWDMEMLLKDFGMINAVNLDGGGSATFVVNGTVVNYPYDPCPDGSFACARKTSTILCVHAPYCEPDDCNGHGKCVMGECLCSENWLGSTCDLLFCGQKNCSVHGICTKWGCMCEPGWEGADCENKCKNGWHGLKCQQPCRCLNKAVCDHITGFCSCKPGFMGSFCEHDCPFGYFGANCGTLCNCKNSCSCDAVTGACDNETSQHLNAVAHCISQHAINQKVTMDHDDEERKRFVTMIIQSIVTTISVTTCVVLVFFSYTCYCRRRQRLCRKKKQYRNQRPIRIGGRESSDSSSESETILMRNVGNS